MRIRQQRGNTGEDIAARYLETRGFKIVARNWRPGKGLRGELDCIAWEGQVLCFVEVKTRTSNQMGAPQEAVNSTKQRQICKLANAFLSARQWSEIACRFDVVEVWLDPENQTLPRVALHRNAFDFGM